ncbi:hypothetical protein SCHPADRAFT_939633 [Schizopora paradoxa]|uniref:Uncharacterized protein n=1 Tax=Schizopora paradoxa TaxID=27342 RepID=A0A0H2RR22_9AGAM|nr:hypothetical protein SCHPADRAFT_939633 [Schizopora paradoxa]
MSDKRISDLKSTSYNRIYQTLEPSPLTYRPSRFFGPRIQMVFFFVVGVLFAILHHSYYAYLDNKELTTGRGVIFRQQGIANAIGNSLAYAVNTLFGVAISIAFVQQFWLRLRSHSGGMSISEIDIMSGCRERMSPISALRAWYTAFGLFMISCLATSMTLINVWTPGALHVMSANFHRQEECVVTTVRLPNHGAVGPYIADWYQRRTILQGSYIPPPIKCGGRPCRYQVSYTAPAFNCTNITSNYDFTSFQKNPLNNTDQYYIYNGTAGKNEIAVQVAYLDTTTKLPEAIQCGAYNASYKVTVTQSNLTAPTVDIHSLEFIAPVPYDVNALHSTNASGIKRLISSAVELLVGEIYATRDSASIGPIQSSNVLPTPIMNSPLLFFTHAKPYWTTDMISAIPSIMQNISLSLLSNEVQDASAKGVKFRHNVRTSCFFNSNFYYYERSRLLATYGGAIIVTALCIAVGLWAIRRNGGVEETMEFSRMVDALVNTQIYDAREQLVLTKETRLRSNPSENGMLQPL